MKKSTKRQQGATSKVRSVKATKGKYVQNPRAPLSIGYSIKNVGDGILLTGCEQLTTVGTAANGTYSGSFGPINQNDLPNTWLGYMMKGYQRWKPLKFSIMYKPQCPTTTYGRVGIVLRPDILDPPGQVQNLMNYSNAQVCPVYESSESHADCKQLSRPWYYVGATATGVNSADNIPFNWQYGTDAGTAAILVGHVYIKYEIMLRDRILPAINN